MSKTIDELRGLVKEKMDDTSYKSEGIGIWVIIASAIGIIMLMIQCNHEIIVGSLKNIVFLSSLFMLLIAPMANLLYYLDSRDLGRNDIPSISTFNPNPFIGDNIVKSILLLSIILLISILGKGFVSLSKIIICVEAALVMLFFELSSIVTKKYLKQNLSPTSFVIFISPAVLAIVAAVLILPEFTKGMPLDIILFSLSISGGISLVYFTLYVFYLSPKTQLHLKLRACYNRLLSREELDYEEEETRIQKALNGLFFSELFMSDLRKLAMERHRIVLLCSKIYELLDFKNDYSDEAFERINKAAILVTETDKKYESLLLERDNLSNKINKEAKILVKHRADYEQYIVSLRQISTIMKTAIDDADCLIIVFQLCNIKLDEFRRYYKKNQELFCKYAPYNKRFGHFIGCIIIPKIDKFLHRLLKKN